MNDDQFKKLFRYMQDMRQDMDEAMQGMDKKLDGIRNVLDSHTGMLDTDEIERLALSAQVDRHDDWIHKAANKIELRYSDT